MDDRAASCRPARAWSRNTRVQHGARRRVQAEADIGQAEDDLDVGEFRADRRDALQRPLRQLAVVLVAGGDGEGQRVDQQVGLRQAVLVAGEIDQPAGDAQLVLRRSSPCRLRRWSARSPRRRSCFASISRSAACASPSSKLIELMIGLPPCSFSAASITGVSVLSITSGAFTEAVKRRITSFISAVLVAADEGGADIQRVRAFADLLAAHGDAAVPVAASPAARATSSSRWRCSARRWRRSRSPAAAAPPDRGWRRRAPRPACARPAPGGTRRRACAASRPARRCAAIVVPQQPPIRLTPSSATKRSSQVARSAAPSG